MINPLSATIQTNEHVAGNSGVRQRGECGVIGIRSTQAAAPVLFNQDAVPDLRAGWNWQLTHALTGVAINFPALRA